MAGHSGYPQNKPQILPQSFQDILPLFNDLTHTPTHTHTHTHHHTHTHTPTHTHTQTHTHSNTHTRKQHNHTHTNTHTQTHTHANTHKTTHHNTHTHSTHTQNRTVKLRIFSYAMSNTVANFSNMVNKRVWSILHKNLDQISHCGGNQGELCLKHWLLIDFCSMQNENWYNIPYLSLLNKVD